MKKKESKTQEQEILNLLSGYSKALKLLWQYDEDKLKIAASPKAKFFLSYQDAKKIVEKIKAELIAVQKTGDLFGQEYRGKFESVVKNLYQTFGGKELYKSIGEQAAHLLYLTVKDHPFADGNKRIAAFLFVYFLDRNNYLYKNTGENKINNSALVALTLFIAISNPKDKDTMIKIITNLLK